MRKEIKHRKQNHDFRRNQNETFQEEHFNIIIKANG